MHGLPERRGLTRLTRETVPTLIDDFSERSNNGGDARQMSLVGADCSAIDQLVENETLPRALDAFSKREEGPVQIVIFQLGDLSYEQLWITHRPSNGVLRLLWDWGILPRRGVTARYENKGLTSLEALYRLNGT